MEIRILHLKEGAAMAEGTAVIIDVFRAFSLEAWLYEWGAEMIYPAADLDLAYRLKQEHPDYVLIGERHGKILPGFDFGNSPSTVNPEKIRGKTVVHTTSAGTQGVSLASGADEILSGSLLNASAIARYLKKKNPDIVSLVCMGWEGQKDTEEDVLCAEYIRSILEGHPLEDIAEQAENLKYTEGKKFFDPSQQDVFPQGDFAMCIAHDRFDFVIRMEADGDLVRTEKVLI